MKEVLATGSRTHVACEVKGTGGGRGSELCV